MAKDTIPITEPETQTPGRRLALLLIQAGVGYELIYEGTGTGCPRCPAAVAA